GRPDGSDLRRTLGDYTDFVNRWQGPLAGRKAATAAVTRPTTMLWLIVTVGALLINAGRASPSTLLPFLVLGVTFGPELLGVAYAVGNTRESTAAARRIGLALAEPELSVPDEPVRPTPPERGATVRFRGVTFGYRSSSPVVHDLDLDLEPGTLTALVGPSGSGKSTLASLLARFHDVDAGSITVAGHDLRDIDPTALHRLVGFVFQDVRLVQGTIRDNLL